ncbi:S41 family peptidase [Candidatus Nomurabacteria bacterium]|nr:S41 family peptidase [Candidatus Nomurabacteria bacterium]
MNDSKTENSSTKLNTKTKSSKKISLGLFLVSILIAFTVGTRTQFIGDYFFSPYTNKGNQTLSSNLDLTETQKIYDILRKKYDGKLDTKTLEEGLQKGLVDAVGDPYTTYFTQKEAEQFTDDLNGTFTGIGAELGIQNKQLVVIAPVDGSPAQKAGVRAGDAIVKIGDEDATKLTVEEAVTKIRGEAGTDVKIVFVRDGKPLEIIITRAEISVPSVTSKVVDGIGYLKISRFSDDTAGLAKQAATDFKKQNVRGVVVDVRDNGGGLLDSSVQVAGIWLNNKVVVEEREGGKTTDSLRTSNNPILEGIPTAMLINGGSASASEILAGALHDHGVATLIGEKSFGKGSVQELIDLPSGGKLKVTVARWYTPKGKNIDKAGIMPDEEVKLTADDFNNGRDPQKDRAFSNLKK